MRVCGRGTADSNKGLKKDISFFRFPRRDALPGQSQLAGKAAAKNRPLSVQFNPQQQIANGVQIAGDEKESNVPRVSNSLVRLRSLAWSRFTVNRSFLLKDIKARHQNATRC